MQWGKFLARLILVIVIGLCGFVLAGYLVVGMRDAIIGGAVAGLAAIAIIVIENLIQPAPLRTVIGGVIGLGIGFAIANVMSQVLSTFLVSAAPYTFYAYAIVYLLSCYIGLSVGSAKGEEFDWYRLPFLAKKRWEGENYKILDTSVIIDGRIADAIETGFIEGTLVIPQFILHELQHVADSQDPSKRARGRRGLDILQRIQKSADVVVKISEQDFPNIRSADQKLVALAKRINAKVVTNDYNLNKVAELQGVSVLNINQLSTALRPVVLPGESLSVHILREGKEEGQGVAYLDDGTMVVVDNARRYLGRNVDVAVTSVLQTTAGRMIFTRLKEDMAKQQAAN